jgi:hypothetical protein
VLLPASHPHAASSSPLSLPSNAETLHTRRRCCGYFLHNHLCAEIVPRSAATLKLISHQKCSPIMLPIYIDATFTYCTCC